MRVLDASELHVSISRGNAKMGSIPSVSLPPVKTCSPEAVKFCGRKCYVKRYVMRRQKTVGAAYERNLYLLNNDPVKFWREVNAAVAMATHFRFGVSGDIPNMAYLLNMAYIANCNPHCEILCFTKQYNIVNLYLKKLKLHKLPKNLHIILSAWKGLPMENPYNLPEAHVFFKDGTTTAKDGARYCSGNCYECAVTNANCWSLKKGEQIIFKEH
jgi:hypothetical protein